MKVIDETLLISPSLLRMFFLCVASQFPIYLIFYAALNTSSQEYECLDGGIFNMFSKFLIPGVAIMFYTIALVVANKGLFLIEVGGEKSLAPNILKAVGKRRIDLNNEYFIKIARATLQFTQDKNKITVYRFMYSRSDIERLLSLVKI